MVIHCVLTYRSFLRRHQHISVESRTTATTSMFSESSGMDGKGLDLGFMGSSSSDDQKAAAAAAKDILPIDKDPWADTAATSSSADPNDLFASAPPNAFENASSTTPTTTTTEASIKSSDDQGGWANFDSMN